ncbi:MAG: TonB-dependent receptor [Bacteroidota bacterium]
MLPLVGQNAQRMIRSCITFLLVLPLFLDAQDVLLRPVDVVGTDLTPAQALTAISEQQKIPIYFDAAALPFDRRTYTLQQVPLRQALTEILRGTSWRFYTYRANSVVITSEAQFNELEAYKNQFYDALNNRLQRGTDPNSVIVVGAEEPSPAGVTPTIVGRLADALTAEPIIGATVFWTDLSDGTVTDSRGIWEMKVPKGEHQLLVQYIGYADFQRNFDIKGDGFLDMQLRQEATDLETVIVLAEANDLNVTETQAGVSNISVRRIEELPSLLGEADLVRAILTDAGVSSIGEGASGFNVRGGAVDQNLILQGESILLNPSHALGFYSAINPEVIREVSLYKTILPAEYGGRLSSVLAVDLREGSRETFRTRGGLSFVTAKLSVEGPINEGDGSFLIGWRGNYSDWVLREVNVPEVRNSSANFYDLNLLFDYDLSKNDQLSVAAYAAQDAFIYNNDFGFNYGTQSIEGNWLRTINKDWQSDLSLVYNRYRSDREELGGVDNGTLRTGLTYTKLKGKLNGTISKELSTQVGLEAILYEVPGQEQLPLGETSTLPTIQLEDERGREFGLFGEADWSPTEALSFRLGLRLNAYQYLGERTLRAYDDSGIYAVENVTDTLNFRAGEAIQNYFTFEPRLSVRYQLSDEQSVRGGYSRTSQFINQIFNTDTPTPQSQYQLSTPYVKPFLAHNFSLGYFRNFKRNRWQTSVEGFYRAIDQLWDYRDFAVLNLNPYIETELLEGQGRAYGAELSVKGRTTHLDAQVTYTWSRTERQIAGINRAAWFPANFDQTHNLNVLLKYRIDGKQSLTANFVFLTGRPTTAPIAAYNTNGGALSIPVYTNRNALRIPNTHRLDLSYKIGKSRNTEKRFKGSWEITVYNVYGRRNPFSVFYNQNFRTTRDFVANRLSVLGSIVPAISYNFEFQ